MQVTNIKVYFFLIQSVTVYSTRDATPNRTTEPLDFRSSAKLPASLLKDLKNVTKKKK